MLTVRQESEADQYAVLSLIREAFWNLYQPGADEHYLYLQIKKEKAFVPELCLVAEQNGAIVAQIIAYRTKIKHGQQEFETVTFGPVSVDPKNQGQGIGQYLIKQFCEKAKQMGFKAVIIQGYPHFYKRLGFVKSKVYEISDEQGNFSAGLLVYELEAGYLSGKAGSWASEVDLSKINKQQLDELDKKFVPKQKFETKSQDYFQQMLQLSQDDPLPEDTKDMWDRNKKMA